jgi:Uma2 family endonuclease
VLVEAGFVLRRNPDTVRGPDVSFVSHARIPRGRLPVAFIPGAPDLAVEILSPDDRPAEVADRVADYLEAGTKLVWVCDPARRAVTVHRPGLPPETVSSDGWLDGGEVLPGFLCAVWTVLGST